MTEDKVNTELAEGMDYRYYIPYYWKNERTTGFGGWIGEFSLPIDEFNDVKLVQKCIYNTMKPKASSVDDIVPLNFVLVKSRPVLREGGEV